MARPIALWVLAFLAFGGGAAQATSFLYNRTTSNTSGTADSWSAGTNWNAIPVSAPDTTLTIGSPATNLPAGSTIFTNNNIAGDFQLNRLDFTYGSASLSPRPVVTISGNRLEFVNNGATAPVINVSPGGTPSSILIINNPLLLTNDLSVIGNREATLAGIISGGGSLTSTNPSTLTLSAANTYSGGTTVSAGTLLLNNSGAGGTSSAIGTGTLTINGPITLASTAANAVALSTNNAQIWASDFSFFSGFFGATPTRSLNLGTGPVTLTANRVINVGGNDGFPNQSTLTVGGSIGDGGSDFSLTKESQGTLILTGASSYGGGTTIARGAINTSMIGNAGAPGLGTGDITLGTGSSTATLRYIGTGETTDKVITLGGSGVMQIDQAGSGLLKLTSDLAMTGATPKTLGLTAPLSTDGEIAGRITGDVNIVTDGFATWTLSGENTFTGKVTIQSGTLSVSSLNRVVGGAASSNLGAPTTVANGTIAFGGSLPLPGIIAHTAGTLQYTGTGETTDRVVDVSIGNFGTIEQAGTGLLEFTSDLVGNQGLQLAGSTSGTGEFSGAIGGANGVSKFGTGTWTLSAANTYTGPTSVFGGTLAIEGDQSAATGDVTVHYGGTLSGTGTVGGAVTVRGGTISPESVGMLSLSSSATFREGTVCPDDFTCEVFLGTYLVDIFGATSDVLEIDGGLDLSNPLDQISFNGTPDGVTTYVLATYASVAGTFDVADVPSGYSLVYGTNHLDLAPIPEPATMAQVALGLAVMAIVARRSRRSRSSRNGCSCRLL